MYLFVYNTAVTARTLFDLFINNALIACNGSESAIYCTAAAAAVASTATFIHDGAISIIRKQIVELK